MTNQQIYFPYYSGNIKLTKCLGHVSIDKFIFSHQQTLPSNIDLFKEIQKAQDNPKLKRELKHKLYSFTPSVMINKWDKRSYQNIKYFTGLMQLDFDGIPTIEDAINLKHWIFQQPEIICCYFSPSKGIKALAHVYKSQTIEQYKRLHNAIAEKYEATTYFDESTKNAVLPLFLSMDTDILWRPIEETKMWSAEKEIKIEHQSLNNTPSKSEAQPNFNSAQDKYYYDKTLRIFTNKINSINESGHPQVRSACLILGSRVGAGYIDLADAVSSAKFIIGCNKYLSKGTQGYIETAEWAINQGINNPKYY